MVETNVGFSKRLKLYPTHGATNTTATAAETTARPMRLADDRSRPRLPIHTAGTATSRVSEASSARTNVSRPHSAPNARIHRRDVPRSTRYASSRIAATSRIDSDSDMMRPSFIQRLGSRAAIPVATRPTTSPPSSRASSPDHHHRAETDEHHGEPHEQFARVGVVEQRSRHQDQAGERGMVRRRSRRDRRVVERGERIHEALAVGERNCFQRVVGRVVQLVVVPCDGQDVCDPEPAGRQEHEAQIQPESGAHRGRT